MIHEVARHEKTLIPEDFSYTELTGLTLEAREKLAQMCIRDSYKFTRLLHEDGLR